VQGFRNPRLAFRREGTRRLWAGGLALLSALEIGVSGCSKHDVDSSEKRLVTAAVVAVVPADLVKSLAIASEFKPFQEVDVHAKVAGYVKVIKVDIGDLVRTGQVIAVLEVPELEQDVARTRAAQRRSQQDILQARSEILRFQAIARQADLTYRRMFSVNEQSPNLVAQQEIDVAQAQANASAAELSARRAALAAAEQQLAEADANARRAATYEDYATITAPFDGVVTKRYADTGAMVAQGTRSSEQAMPVVRVAQVDPLRLSFPVPESEIAAVRVGGPVVVHVPAIERSMTTRIWRFTGKADEATRTMETQVLIENPSRDLKPGMTASVELTVDRRPRALAIPIEAAAITGDPHASNVLVVAKDDRVEERPVVLGMQTATQYEVVSGLAAGERVIVAGRSQFRTGQHVIPKIVSFRSASNAETGSAGRD
jgi:RND family efflux transporter MFP subunit